MVKVFSARKVQDRRGGTKRERERGGEMRSDQTHIILYATLPICHERLHGTEVHPTPKPNSAVHHLLTYVIDAFTTKQS